MEQKEQSGKRRAASRATKLRRRKRRMNFLLAAIAIAVIALIVLICPKEPLGHATYTNATESGLTEDVGGKVVGTYDGLVISEIMSANSCSVTDENGNYKDWIEIWNSTDHNIDLTGVGLSDKSDRIKFLFPSVSIVPDGRIIVFCDGTNHNDPESPFHAKIKLTSVGETVYLYDPHAYQIDHVKYPIMSADTSWALTDDGFKEVTWYSPEYENTPEGHQKYRESVMIASGAVVINEIMADPMTGPRDEDGELCDWIELYNSTDKDIPLENYALSDNEGKPLKWRFPEGSVIPANGYYLVYCSGKDRIDTSTGVPHTNFRISAESETLILADGQGHVVDRVMIDNLPLDCSYGRNENDELQIFQIATPGLPNTKTGAQQMDTYLRAMNPTGVYISEVLASNEAVATYADAGFVDWIELYNSSSGSVDLSGYGLSDRLDRARKWQFPQGTIIGAGEYKVVLCDRITSANTVSQLHTSFKINRTAGETLCLADPEGRVLDKVILPEMRTDVSYGRTYGMSGFFYYKTPTPFKANEGGFTGYAETPSFTLEPGMYYTTVYAGMEIPEKTQVYYTTDGSLPTQQSTLYGGERLELNFTTVLRARAFSAEGLEPSDTITGTYLISAYHTLPVVSVVTDPDNLWNRETGMLVTGDNVVKEPGKLPFKNTVYRAFGKVGRECYIEIYDTSGSRLISQGCQFSLMGQFSLDMPQKSFKFKAKSKYGEKTFAAKLFADRDFTEFKSLVLRNSGNDCMWTRLQDGFQSRLMDAYGATVLHQAWQPVAVYLNGTYWGHMNLRERVDRYFVAQHEGLSLEEADQMTILEASGTANFGSNKDYKAMIKKIKAGNPAKNEEDLQYILDNVDTDNLFEYMAFEMFFGNSDIGNTRFYRIAKDGGKWKWILYDVDYGLYNSQFNSPKSFTKEKGMGEKNIDNTIFVKLLSVPEYRDRFLTKFGDVFQTLTTEYMLSVLEPLVEQITPEMELHWARWGEENDQYVISEVPVTVDGAYRYWEKRVERLRNVVRKRPTYLWEFIQDAFKLSNNDMVKYFGEKPIMPADAVL